WRAVGRRIETEVTSQQLPKLALAFSASANASIRNQPIPAVGAINIATATIYYTVDWPLATQGHPPAAGGIQANINSITGTINSYTFDGIYPPYTLLCLAPKRQLVIQADQNFCVRMTYVFAQRGTQDVSGTENDSAYPDWRRILNGNSDTTIAYSVV